MTRISSPRNHRVTAPFEEPAKAEMRAACEIAIDQGGFGAGHGADGCRSAGRLPLAGPTQGRSSKSRWRWQRYCYYLRPRAGETLPEWLANLATAAHSIPDAKLYIVVDHASPAFERACKVAGAGLLAINEDKQFEMLLNFDQTLPEELDEALKQRISAARSELQTRSDLKLGDLQSRFEKIGELTQGMAPDIADKYAKNVERQYKLWTEWADAMSARLDNALAERDAG